MTVTRCTNIWAAVWAAANETWSRLSDCVCVSACVCACVCVCVCVSCMSIQWPHQNAFVMMCDWEEEEEDDDDDDGDDECLLHCRNSNQGVGGGFRDTSTLVRHLGSHLVRHPVRHLMRHLVSHLVRHLTLDETPDTWWDTCWDTWWVTWHLMRRLVRHLVRSRAHYHSSPKRLVVIDDPLLGVTFQRRRYLFFFTNTALRNKVKYVQADGLRPPPHPTPHATICSPAQTRRRRGNRSPPAEQTTSKQQHAARLVESMKTTTDRTDLDNHTTPPHTHTPDPPWKTWRREEEKTPTRRPWRDADRIHWTCRWNRWSQRSLSAHVPTAARIQDYLISCIRAIVCPFL